MQSGFLRNSTFGSLAGLSATLGSFLSGLIVARMLGVEMTGIVALAIWGAAMASSVASVGIPFTISRFLPEMEAKGEHAEAAALSVTLFWPYLLLSQLPALAFIGLAVWAYNHPVPLIANAEPAISSDPLICVVLAFYCTIQSISDYARGYLRGIQAFRTVAINTMIGMATQLVGIAIGAYYFSYHGAVIGYLIGNLPFLYLIRRVIGWPQPLPAALKSRLIRYSGYRWAAEIAAVLVWSRVELFFLQAWWGPESVGLFTVGLTLANLAVLGPLMLTWGLLPRFAEQFGRNETENMQAGYAIGTRILAFLVFPACFGLAAIMPEFLPLLFGEAFRSAVPIGIVLVCGAAITSTTAVGGNVMLAMERSDIDFYSGLLGAVLTAISGFVIIAIYGAMGAAWSRVVSQTLVVAFSCYMLVGRLGFSMPYRELLRLFAASMLCAAAARLTLHVIPGATGLPFAIVAGAATYFAGVRLLGALTDADISSLRSLSNALPGPFGQIAAPMLRFISR